MTNIQIYKQILKVKGCRMIRCEADCCPYYGPTRCELFINDQKKWNDEATVVKKLENDILREMIKEIGL